MKTLKLTGLRCYSGPRVNNQIVENGQTVTVSDDHAEIMLEGFEWGKEGRVPHWTEVSADVAPVAVEAVEYEDGVKATGPAPLPEQSPEVYAQPQEPAKEATSAEAAPKKTQRVRRNA